MTKIESFDSFANRLWGYELEENVMASKNVTFQVTEDCNLSCGYCYQHNKTNNSMDLDTGKKMVDLIIKEYTGECKTIILEFIGGEPFLEIELIHNICDYWERELLKLNHEWLQTYRISICSNGLLYNTEKVQNFMEVYQDRISFTVTIDGNKELHDSARLTHDGKPSYDIAYSAAKNYEKKFGAELGSKITIAPSNLIFLYHAIKYFIDDGALEINANCVFEEGWKIEDAKVYYTLLKKIADYLIKTGKWKEVTFSRFVQTNYSPMDENDLNPWCGGGSGKMLAVDYKGDLYPCLRFMKSSLGEKRKAITCGSIKEGVDREVIKDLNSITRREESNDECFYCPVAAGCAYCMAHNYEVFGTIRSRAVFTCDMHKAESLANVYYWNTIAKNTNDIYRFKMHLPKEDALKIISEEEYNLLYLLQQ